MTLTNIGIETQQSKAIIDALCHLLADTYTLYLKTHNFHWNVTGLHFRTLHHLFEDQHLALAVAVDDIAERIRILGGMVPGTYTSLMKLTCLEESEELPDALKMTIILASDNEKVVNQCRNVLLFSNAALDESTSRLVSERLSVHEIMAWHLRSIGE